MKVLEQEKPEEEQPPYAPPDGCGHVDMHCMQQTAFGEEQPQTQKQRQRPAHEGGRGGQLLAFPRRQRLPREPREAAARAASMDGEDAAMWEEATRVMRACGVDPDNAGRKVRASVLGALRLRWEMGDLAIAEVGELMIQRWQEYRKMGWMLFAPLGFTRFIASGEWLNPSLWRLNLQGLEMARRGRMQ
jgi:hypothetical protein